MYNIYAYMYVKLIYKHMYINDKCVIFSYIYIIHIYNT